jgi:hypothetical protein
MISERVEQFKHEAQEKLQDLSRFNYFTRGIEFQYDSADSLRRLRERCIALKKEGASKELEQLANDLLYWDLVLEAVEDEFRMWIALKEDKTADAWDHLVEAQCNIEQAMRLKNTELNLDSYLKKLLLEENLLFPSQLFASVGFVVKEATCSICGSVYGTCDHIKGRVYMGEVCSRIISKAQLKEVSLVADPANKHCRILSVTDETGQSRDFLTWRIIEENRMKS